MVEKNKYYYNSFYAMGTRFEGILPGVGQEKGNMLFKDINSVILRLMKMLNRHDKKSAVYALNNRKKNEVDVSYELWDIIRSCKLYNEKTLGGFDITMKPLMELWSISHGQKTNDHEPGAAEIKKVLGQAGMDKIILDECKQKIAFENNDIEIDLGGFGKGYALEKVRELLIANKIENAFISFGDSSIYALGHHPHGNYWQMGIRHPEKPQKNMYTFQVKDQALSTSGAFAYFESSNSKYGHIINPASGYPVEAFKGISVSTASPMDAEILSTALIVKNSDEKQEILNKFVGCKAIEIDYKSEKVIEINYDDGK